MLLRRTKSWRFYARAEAAADDLLADVLGVEKAAGSILTHPGFEAVVRRLVGKISKVTGPADLAALRKAAKALDRDWPNLAAAEREKIISAAAKGFLDVPKVVVPKVVATLQVSTADVVSTAKKATGDVHSLAVVPSLSTQDQRIVDFSAKSQGSYVTDAYGVRATDFEERARKIVSAGLEAGLGREDIAERLAADLTDPLLGRARAYWDQVASIHVARARTYGQMAAYTDAGVERYEIDAAKDEVTCVICYAMDGRTFSVETAMDAYARVEASDDPYSVEDEQPFIQVGTTDEGQRFLYARSDGMVHHIATILSDPSGERDGAGRYEHVASASKIEDVGCQQPPFHGRCRCLTVPE
jgi:hypothetical protein